MKSFTSIIALVLAFTASSASAEEYCTASFTETAVYALKSDTFTSVPDFLSHNIINLGPDAYLLFLGNLLNDGEAVHIINVTSPNGSTSVVVGNIHVVSNRVVLSEFCAIVTETAL
jgi:hypothetical protein